MRTALLVAIDSDLHRPSRRTVEYDREGFRTLG
jgi:hypothetical protein